MPTNNVPAFHNYLKAENTLIKNGFKFSFGDPIQGVRFDSPDYMAIVRLVNLTDPRPTRYEVYAYKKQSK